VFASHVFDRFAERAQMGIGECLSEFIVAFFHSMLICLRVNHGSDAVISYYGLGNLAMPVEERPDEFFVVTALGPNEINHLEAPGPLRPMHLHYGRAYQAPPTISQTTERSVAQTLAGPLQPVDDASDLPALAERTRKFRWTQIVRARSALMESGGYYPDTQAFFYDDIHGPILVFTNLRPESSKRPAPKTDGSRSKS